MSGPGRNTGIGQYTFNLLTRLTEVAPDLGLVAYCGPGEPRPGWLPGEVEWRPARRGLHPKFAAIEARLFELPALARADGLGLFHSTGIHVRPSFPPVPRLHCPVVATIHDLLPLTHYQGRLPLRLRLFYRWNLDRAASSARVVTVSEHSRREIGQGLAIDLDRVTVIPNGVEFPPNHERAPLEALGVISPYLLYAGSYEPRKNFAGALEAFGHLVAKGFPHRLVAIVERSSGHAPAIQAQLARLRLEDRVLLLHSLADADLRAVYTHAEVLMFPSLGEGFGFPPLQGAACGVPVVASDLPVLREILDGAAEFADPTDPAALAGAVERLLGDPERRSLLSGRGPDQARRFSVEDFVEKHAQLYRAALESTRQPVAAPS